VHHIGSLYMICIYIFEYYDLTVCWKYMPSSFQSLVITHCFCKMSMIIIGQWCLCKLIKKTVCIDIYGILLNTEDMAQLRDTQNINEVVLRNLLIQEFWEWKELNIGSYESRTSNVGDYSSEETFLRNAGIERGWKAKNKHANEYWCPDSDESFCSSLTWFF
jgi:hypothetical protein